MQNFEEFKQLINEPGKKIVITTHFKPDADALGSSLALYHYLKKKGHDPLVITPSEYPAFLFWMEGNDDVLVYDRKIKAHCQEVISDADMIFALDFSALHRIFDLGTMVDKAEGIKVLIDHHRDPEHFADYELWDVNAAATAELIYDLMDMMGETDLIDQGIAECLYAGIMTDTGSFRFPSTSAKIHLIIADLIKKGADNAKVHQLVYDNFTESRLRLLGHILSQKLTVLPEYNTAYITLSRKELYKYNAQTGDTEGIVNYALGIRGIKFAALMKESDGIIKMSFRSVGDFAVSDFSKNHFSGGGHKNAAGGRSEESLDETEKKFLNLLPAYKNRIC